MKVFNTLTKKKEEFVPLEEGKVRMYVCGPTVYNYIHIGNARPMIVFDTVRRYFEYKGYDVNYVSNFTDVDDKIIKKAIEEQVSAQEISQRYIAECKKDMAGMNVKPATKHPLATEEICGMVEMISELIDKGYAYEKNGTVYFSTRKFKDYGKLSHKNLDDLRSGGRSLLVSGEDEKEDPLDFVLWKPKKDGEPYWESPWCKGRPGWHIECSAMSKKYLGLPFDIHGGGADLAFPHHENERAQSEAAFGCTFSNYWMHGGMLQINHEKMSKSLGNFLLLRDVLKTTDARVLRMLMLQTHYRSPLDFSDERLGESEAMLSRLTNFVKNTAWLCANAEGETTVDLVAYQKAIDDMCDSFIEAMDDDFNTAGALGAICSFVREANTILTETAVSSKDAAAVLAGADAVCDLLSVLGVDLNACEDKECDSSNEVVALAVELAGFTGCDAEGAIEALLVRRAEARKEKNFALADAVRDRLGDLGFVVEDTPQGARVSRA